MASGGETGTRTLVIGGTVVGAIGIGWFVLSHVIMGTSASDAAVEALGVMLAITVVASVIGAVIGSLRGRLRADEADEPQAGSGPVRSRVRRP